VEQDGIQAWWDLDPASLMSAEDADKYEKVLDTLDVWFDSGVTHYSVVDQRDEFNGFGADMYLEGSDQHRGWFQSSLISSIAMKDQAPYKQVLTHGFVVDGNGRKMSKSIGNVVAPKDVTNRLGADILRLWVASTDYTGEVAVSDEILKRSADAYRRIRNTSRFFLANLNGFNPETDIVPVEEMVALDRWAVGRAQAAQAEIVAGYDCYNTHAVTQRLMQFCSIEMGSFYLDVIKDRQYTARSGGHAQRSCQTALYYILEAMVRWMAPIMSFTADEIWSHMPSKLASGDDRAAYVFTEVWYDGLFGLAEGELLNDDFWQDMQEIRAAVNKLLESARKEKLIGGALQAEITLYVDDAIAEKIGRLEDELRFVMLTSKAEVQPLSQKSAAAQETELAGLWVEVTASEAEKCDRCWHHVADVGSIEGHEKICGRCVSNLAGDGEKRRFA
jgi:isoleucyl-tRNA synthetase